MLLKYVSVVLAAATVVTGILAFAAKLPVEVCVVLALATVGTGYAGRWIARTR